MNKSTVAKGAAVALVAKKLVRMAVVAATLTAVAKVLRGRAA